MVSTGSNGGEKNLLFILSQVNAYNLKNKERLIGKFRDSRNRPNYRWFTYDLTVYSTSKSMWILYHKSIFAGTKFFISA